MRRYDGCISLVPDSFQPTGRRIGKDHQWYGSILKDRAHICAFFNSPDKAYRVLLPFVKEGLELGQKALYTN